MPFKLCWKSCNLPRCERGRPHYKSRQGRQRYIGMIPLLAGEIWQYEESRFPSASTQCKFVSNKFIVMKKKTFNPFAKFFLFGLIGLSTLSSCRKSTETADTNPQEFAGVWKLSDLMLVNAGDKPPRKLEELPRLNDLRFILSPNGQLYSGNNEPGTWSVAKDRLLIKFDGEELLDLKVSKLEPAFMVLEQSFNATDGSDGGTIYYAFAK